MFQQFVPLSAVLSWDQHLSALLSATAVWNQLLRVSLVVTPRGEWYCRPTRPQQTWQPAKSLTPKEWLTPTGNLEAHIRARPSPAQTPSSETFSVLPGSTTAKRHPFLPPPPAPWACSSSLPAATWNTWEESNRVLGGLYRGFLTRFSNQQPQPMLITKTKWRKGQQHLFRNMIEGSSVLLPRWTGLQFKPRLSGGSGRLKPRPKTAGVPLSPPERN